MCDTSGLQTNFEFIISQAEDSVLAFGPLAANHFGARFAHIAWAGAGILPTNANKGTPSIPQLYNRTLPRDPSSDWDHATFVPQVRACDSMCMLNACWRS